MPHRGIRIWKVATRVIERVQASNGMGWKAWVGDVSGLSVGTGGWRAGHAHGIDARLGFLCAPEDEEDDTRSHPSDLSE